MRWQLDGYEIFTREASHRRCDLFAPRQKFGKPHPMHISGITHQPLRRGSVYPSISVLCIAGHRCNTLSALIVRPPLLTVAAAIGLSFQPSSQPISGHALSSSYSPHQDLTARLRSSSRANVLPRPLFLLPILLLTCPTNLRILNLVTFNMKGLDEPL